MSRDVVRDIRSTRPAAAADVLPRAARRRQASRGARGARRSHAGDANSQNLVSA